VPTAWVFLWILANPSREGRGWCNFNVPTVLAGRVRQELPKSKGIPYRLHFTDFEK